MKTKYSLILASFLIALFSCSEKKTTESGEIDLEGALAKAESRRKADPNASGGNTCLLAFQNKYDELLQEGDVLKATGFSKEKMETEYSKVLKNPEYHNYSFSFKNGRKRKSGIGKGLSMDDFVKVSGIKAMSLSDFENNFRAVSDEEMQAAKDIVNDAAEGNSEEADVNEAVKKAKGISSETVKKVGGGVLDAIKNVSKGYRTVEDLGESARWNIVTNELVVLQNGVIFTINSEVNDDTEINKKVAVELAKIILDKCN